MRYYFSCNHFITNQNSNQMAKYSKGAGEKVKEAMHEKKEGSLKSGRSGKKVTSSKQAIAIGLSEARKEGAKMPSKKSAAKKGASKKSASKKGASTKGASKKTASKKGATKKAAAKKSSAAGGRKR
jgi:hypothetical protein